MVINHTIGWLRNTDAYRFQPGEITGSNYFINERGVGDHIYH